MRPVAAVMPKGVKRDPASRRTERARHGTPEGERDGVAVKLRLAASVAERLRELATERGLTLAALVTEWIERGT